jgi:AhpD family alkylhydroperoxidase
MPEILAGFWCAFRESLIAGPASRAAREAVAQGVAEINRCPYCKDVHSMMLDGAIMLDGATSAALSQHPHIGSFHAWARASRTPGADILSQPPFASPDAAQFIGTALVFHYLNRLVTVFLGKSPLPPPSQRLARNVTTKLLAKRIVSVNAAPGATSGLLPRQPIPPDLTWAQDNPHVAQAFAQFYAEVESAANTTISAETRSIVESQLAGWNGEDPGIGTVWIDDAVSQVPDSQKAATRLLLLTALAPYRVDERPIAEFRERCPSDAELVTAVAWAACAATRRTASWLSPK